MSGRFVPCSLPAWDSPNGCVKQASLVIRTFEATKCEPVCQEPTMLAARWATCLPLPIQRKPNPCESRVNPCLTMCYPRSSAFTLAMRRCLREDSGIRVAASSAAWRWGTCLLRAALRESPALSHRQGRGGLDAATRDGRRRAKDVHTGVGEYC